MSVGPLCRVALRRLAELAARQVRWYTACSITSSYARDAPSRHDITPPLAREALVASRLTFTAGLNSS
jgi:hypothetical protein